MWSDTVILKEQLNIGVRYLDLRVFWDSETDIKYLIHGFEGAELLKELADIAQFVTKHPGEIVILDMNHIYKCANIQVFSMLKKIEELFGDKLCPPPSQNGSVSKYGEMIEAGKRVIVAFTDRPHEFSSTYQPSEVRSKFEWIWTSETNIEKHWAYTTNVDKLKRELKKEGPPKSFQFHVTQTILTPRTEDIIHGIFWRPHNLEQMAQKLNRHLPNWFESGDLNLNIATVDFLTPDLTTVLVNQNKVSC